MLDAKQLSKQIRMKKKHSLRPDMDDAGQEGVQPTSAWEAKMDADVNDILGDDHAPASDAEMGEHESSQDLNQLKKAMARIAKYIDAL